jgi:hypothetical protein
VGRDRWFAGFSSELFLEFVSVFDYFKIEVSRWFLEFLTAFLGLDF